MYVQYVTFLKNTIKITKKHLKTFLKKHKTQTSQKQNVLLNHTTSNNIKRKTVTCGLYTQLEQVWLH